MLVKKNAVLVIIKNAVREGGIWERWYTEQHYTMIPR